MKPSWMRLAVKVTLAILTLVVMIPDAAAFPDYSGCAGCHGDFTASSYTSLKGASGGTWTTGLHDTHRSTMLSGDCTACHSSGSRTPVLMNSSASAAPFNTSCLGCHGRVEGTAGLTGRGLRAHHEKHSVSCFGCHGETAASPVVAESVKPPLYITNAAHPNLPKDPCNPSPAFPENFAGTTLGLDNDGNDLYDAADPACTLAAPTINLNPSSLAFGSVNAGTTSAAQTSAIQNTGTAVLTVTAIALCAGTSAEFGFTAPATPFTVAAGGSANLSVTYAPTGAGTDTGCIAVTSNASNSPTANLAVSGTGVTAPKIAVAPTSLSFGNVTVGGAPGSQTFQISNTGNATLTGTVTRAAGTSTEFAFSPATFSIAAGGAAVTVTGTYTPTAVGADGGSIVVSSNDTTNPSVSVTVSGTGVAAPAPKIAVAPTTLPFGNVTVGSSGSQAFTISNTGNATLTGTLALAGGTSTEFTFSTASFSIPSGGAAVTVTVNYTPTAIGADTGSIVVSSNDTTNPTVSVTVNGTGVTAPAPTIALVPSTLSFGTVSVGGSASLTTQVQNNGNAVLNVSAITLGAGTSGEFTWSPAAPLTVAAGGSATVTVTYTPTNAGTDSGTIAFTSNAATSPTSLSVTGTGQAAAAPAIAVSPTSLSFGNVTAGTTSAPQTFTISNTGTATLTGTLALASGTSAEFAFAPASFSIVQGGAPVTVSVTYAPTAVGADTGSIVVSSNDTTHPNVGVTVSGTGTAVPQPSIVLVPNTLSFGNVTLGNSSSLTTAVTNTGTATLTVSAIAPCTGTSAEFTFTSPAVPFTVSPGGSASVAVTYTPTDLGTDSGCIAFSSNDPASPTVSLGVSGTGVAQPFPAIAVSPLSLDFGTVTVGSSASRTTTIQNTGTGPLSVTGISLSSGTSTEFSWSPAAPFSVAAGASITLTVTYQPIDASTDTGSIVIASNDPASPSVSVSVTGTGTSPTVGVDIDIVELSVPEKFYTRAGGQITPEATLKNASPFAGSGTATLVGMTRDSKVYENVIDVSLAGGEVETFTFPPYTVVPSSNGTISWTLTVQDGDPDVDRATAHTRLSKGVDHAFGRNFERDDSENGSMAGRLREPARSNAVGAAVGEATGGGCATGGGSAGFLALMALMALGVRAARRSQQ